MFALWTSQCSYLFTHHYSSTFVCSTYDTYLQEALKEYLVARGIGESLTNFLLFHLHKKEQGQYVNWLHELKSFVTKVEWDVHQRQHLKVIQTMVSYGFLYSLHHLFLQLNSLLAAIAMPFFFPGAYDGIVFQKNNTCVVEMIMIM